MYLTKLTIKNFEGLQDLELEPGPLLTLLQGRNGAGKTSILEAVRAAIINKTDRSSIVHSDARKGTILFELSDGTTGSRSVKDGGSTVGSVTLKRDGQNLGAPQSVLSKLTAGFGFNPIRFLDLDPRAQSEAILRVIDVALANEEMKRLSGGEWRTDIDYDAHPLEMLKALEMAIYEERRDVNRDAKMLRGAALKMRQGIEGQGIDVDLVQGFDLDSAITKLTRAQDASAKVAKIKYRMGEVAAQIEMLEQEEARLMVELTEALDAQVDPAPLKADIELFKSQQDTWRISQDANDKEKEAVSLEAHSEELTALIEEIRDKPGELLAGATLPIDGLGMSEGNINIHGLPISELSTGESLMLATDIAIATLPAADEGLRIVLVDGLEGLDRANRDAMLQKLGAGDVQVLAAEVTDTELLIISDFYPPPARTQAPDIPF